MFLKLIFFRNTITENFLQRYNNRWELCQINSWRTSHQDSRIFSCTRMMQWDVVVQSGYFISIMIRNSLSVTVAVTPQLATVVTLMLKPLFTWNKLTPLSTWNMGQNPIKLWKHWDQKLYNLIDEWELQTDFHLLVQLLNSICNISAWIWKRFTHEFGVKYYFFNGLYLYLRTRVKICIFIMCSCVFFWNLSIFLIKCFLELLIMMEILSDVGLCNPCEPLLVGTSFPKSLFTYSDCDIASRRNRKCGYQSHFVIAMTWDIAIWIVVQKCYGPIFETSLPQSFSLLQLLCVNEP